MGLDTQLLSGKVIIITGGTKGLGRDLAVACVEQGASVVITGRDQGAAQSILESLNGEKNRALFVRADLTDSRSCSLIFDEAVKAFGKIDGLVNYAGITPIATLLDTTTDVFDAVMSVNFKAAFFCCQQAIAHMAENNGGSIVLINSCHASHGERDRAAYACSKGALAVLASHIAHHYASMGIRCNTVTMGWSATEGEIALRASQGMTVEELRKTASAAIPMGRMQETSDYIPGILYLLSDASSMATGSNLQVSGGLFL